MDNPVLIMVVVFAILLLLLATGMWIGVAMGLVGIGLLVLFTKGTAILQVLGSSQFATTSTFQMTAAPLFIFMGQIIMYSGLAKQLYKAATPWVSFLPGGLIHTNILSCSIFAALCGSSMATCATISSVAIPEELPRNYDRKLVFGSLAAGGTLGVLIPPSVVMIMYAALVDESVGQLFIAGVFPGLTLSGLFMLYIAAISILRPGLAPKERRGTMREMASSVVNMGPIVFLIFMVLGTIYMGLATPTEAAGLGAFFAMVICAIYRKLSWKVVRASALESVKITSWVMFIMIGANVLTTGLAISQAPAGITELIVSLEVSRYILLALVVIFYVILGMFMEAVSMLLLTIPLVYPIMMALGFNSVWFGVLCVIFLEMGVITPPVGTNLFVIHGISGKKYLRDVMVSTTPFVILMLVLITMLAAFPELALWLPGKMFQF